MHQEVNFAGSTKAPELHLWGNKWEKHLQFGQSTKSYKKKKISSEERKRRGEKKNCSCDCAPNIKSKLDPR